MLPMAANNRRSITTPRPRTLKRTALLALFLLLVSPLVAAQPPLARTATNNEDPYNTGLSTTLSILIVAFICVFFLIIFLFIYLRCCNGRRSTVNPAAITGIVAARSRHGAEIRGLDSALLDKFPTMVYSDVKGHKLGKDSLECAVCLCEFENDDIIRLLPGCSHVFHRDCVDVWLASHVTCPVCRSNLAADPLPETDHTAIAVDQEVDLTDLVQIGSQRRLRSGSMRGILMSSRSRGDWEAVIAGGDGRFRLRLPEDVRREILGAGRLRRSSSLEFFPARGEGCLRRGYREDRVCVWRSLRLGRSARWPILGRSLSTRGNEAAAEGSVSGSSKGGVVASVKGSLGVLNGGGGGSRVKPDDGDASTAAYSQV